MKKQAYLYSSLASFSVLVEHLVVDADVPRMDAHDAWGACCSCVWFWSVRKSMVYIWAPLSNELHPWELMNDLHVHEIIMFDYMWFFAILCIISQKEIHCYKGFYRNRAVMCGWTRHRSQKHCRNFLHNIVPIMFIFLDGRLTFEKLITDPAVSNSNGSMFLLL